MSKLTWREKIEYREQLESLLAHFDHVLDQTPVGYVRNRLIDARENVSNLYNAITISDPTLDIGDPDNREG